MHGFGSTFSYAPVGDPLVVAARVKEINSPDVEVTMADASDINVGNPAAGGGSGPNVTEGVRIFDAGLINGGKVSLTLIFTPAEYNRMLTYALAGTRLACEIVYPDGSGDTFDALISKLGKKVPLDDEVEATAEFQVSGFLDFAT